MHKLYCADSLLVVFDVNQNMNFLLHDHLACSRCPIRHRAVCSNCNADEIALLEDLKSYRVFKAGDRIMWRDDELNFVASVVEGVASLSKTLEDGRTQTVGLLFASDFIGRPGRSRIEFDVTAATDLTLCCFDRKRFEKLIQDIPHLAHRLMEIALDELDAARDRMMLLGRKTALEKTASFLETLVQRSTTGQVAQNIHLTLPLTREEIANYLGLTLETVSRQFGQLKKAGVIEPLNRREVIVRDVIALSEAAGNDADGAVVS